MMTSDVAAGARGRAVLVVVLAVLAFTRRVWPAVLVAAAVVLVALTVQRYGDESTVNRGVVLDVRPVVLGWETVGEPGPWGAVSTPLGTAAFGPWGAAWCPTGDGSCTP